MAKFSNKGSADTNSGGGDAAKKKQQLLLLLLLLLVAAFGYLFYFTDVITQRQKPASPPPAQNAQVKQPIPPRPAVAPNAPPATSPGTVPPPAAVPVSATQGTAPPAGADKKPGAPLPAPAPAAPPAVAKVEPAKPAPAPVKAAAPSKPAPAPLKDSAKPALPTAAAVKQAAPAVKPAVKEATTAAATAKDKKPAPIISTKYTLVIGEFSDATQVKTAKARLAKIGIKKVSEKGVKLVEPMNRIFIGTFPDRTAAEMELQNIRKATVDGFILPQNGAYALYAGSYLSEKLAASELKRINALGVKGEIRKAKLPVNVTQLTGGSFAGKAPAEEAAKQLRKDGYKVTTLKLK